MNVKLLIIMLVGLANCSGAASEHYVGYLDVEQGSCSPHPLNSSRLPATLVLRGDQAEFIPEDGVVVLTGQIDSAGHLLISSNAPGADHKPFLQVFEGDRRGNQITGQFATPSCRATVKLSRR